jgi:phosphotransferase family enzyme
MTVAEAVSGSEKLAGARWLLLGREPEQAFRQTLSALLDDPRVLGPCRLRRVRFKPGHKLTALYDVTLQGHSSRPVAVEWRGHRSAGWRKVQRQIDEIEAVVAKRSLLQPFRALAAESREWNLRIQIAPLDTEFPQLARVFDPRYLSEKPWEISEGTSKAPAEFAYRPAKVEFVRFQPHIRHVLCFEQASPERNAAVFAKLSLPNDSAQAFRVSTEFHEWLAQQHARVTCVRPLAFDAVDSVVLYPQVPGFPLSELLRRQPQDLVARLGSLGKAISALHRTPRGITDGLELRHFIAEIEEIAQASDFVKALLPDEGAAIETLLENAREAIPRLPHEAPTFVHCDLKLEHFLITETGVTLIDFDTCRRGDPALDVGTFLADLRLWYFICARPGVEAAQHEFLEGYSPSAPAARLMRARLYEAIGLIKMAVRRLPLLDGHWTTWMQSLVRDATLIMNNVLADLGPQALDPSSNVMAHSSPSLSDSRAAGTDPKTRTQRPRPS